MNLVEEERRNTSYTKQDAVATGDLRAGADRNSGHRRSRRSSM